MFGEDDSDNPRAPSPWDPFLSSPPSEAASLEKSRHIRHSVPKLVPEVEEGNVEYKLKLTDISPARFARLVTQLKWRLLEGGGQAYYELGVADSGALIGLSRPDLEQSLETLEMMAGEIGASVIVVKEIEVPPAMVALADKVSEYIDPETGEWTDKMVNKRFRGLPYYDLDTDSACATDASSTDIDDSPPDIATPVDTLDMATILPKSGRLLTSNPERPTAQSSPFIAPLDDDLALFSMEPEPEFTIDSGHETPPEATADLPVLTDAASSLNIEIAAVYKPRPVRHRPLPSTAGAHGLARRNVKAKPKEKKVQPWHQTPPDTKPILDDATSIPNRQEAKALLRRLARDRRREEKRKALMALAEAGCVVAEHDQAAGQSDDALPLTPQTDVIAELAAGLDKLAMAAESPNTGVPCVEPELTTDAVDLAEPETGVATNLPAEAHDEQVHAISKEPRLIVEALVVRKLSIEEAFLDFGGFPLAS